MSAPDLTELEEIVRRIKQAKACCYQMAGFHGRSEDGDALYFLFDGLEQIADDAEAWFQATHEAQHATKGSGPRAVS